MNRSFPALLLFVLAIIFTEQMAIIASSPADAPSITFPEVTQQAGIHFVHNNGAFGKKYLPETMGTGVAFID